VQKVSGKQSLRLSLGLRIELYGRFGALEKLNGKRSTRLQPKWGQLGNNSWTRTASIPR
jgi:hypothetical protein